MGITITEGLAEIKTIGNRLEAKRTFIGAMLARQEGVKDPMEKDGGSSSVIEKERQSIRDLQTRIIDIRRGIQRANEQTTVTINGVARSIADWLTWRRDVAPGEKAFLVNMRDALGRLREKAKREGVTLVAGDRSIAETTTPTDWVVNIDEHKLAQEIEQMEETLGQLDGQLSLKNATVTIEF